MIAFASLSAGVGIGILAFLLIATIGHALSLADPTCKHRKGKRK